MKLSCQRGSQIVEFALVLPFLLLLVFVVLDIGFLVYNKAVITNASREAARSASVLTATPWSVANVKAVACVYARDSLINMQPGSHTSTCSGAADPVIAILNPNGNVPPQFGDPVSVTVTYLYSGFLTSFSAWIGLPVWTLSATSQMIHE